jgi:hypothetical protein
MRPAQSIMEMNVMIIDVEITRLFANV